MQVTGPAYGCFADDTQSLRSDRCSIGTRERTTRQLHVRPRLSLISMWITSVRFFFSASIIWRPRLAAVAGAPKHVLFNDAVGLAADDDRPALHDAAVNGLKALKGCDANRSAVG